MQTVPLPAWYRPSWVPVSKLSDEFAELFGSLGEYFGWYGLGGKVEMDKVYCPG